MAEKAPTVGPFDISGPAHEVSARWTKWRRSFTYYVEGKGITDQSRLRSLLLHHAGVAVQDRYATLAEDSEEDNVYKRALDSLNTSFKFQSNKRFERYQLRLMTQKSEETVAQYVARLKAQAEHCEFADNAALEDQVCDQLLVHIRESNLRKKLLGESALTLEKALTLAHQHEATEAHARAMDGQRHLASQESSVNAVSGHGGVRTGARGNFQGTQSRLRSGAAGGTCHNCGRSGHYARDTDCPARGARCENCGKMNHFAVKCRSTRKDIGTARSGIRAGPSTPGGKAYQVAEDNDREESGEEYGFGVKGTNRQPTIAVRIGSVDTSALVDSGATCNLIGRKELGELQARGLDIDLRECSQSLYAYGETKLPVAGEFYATLAVNDRGSRERFVTIDGPGQLILGREAAVSFGVLALPEPANVAHIKDDETLKQQLSKAYPGVFNGVGKLKGVQAHLHVDPDVIPVAQKQRRVPFALEHKVKAKVTELLATDIIQEAEGPTPWVSPVVVAPKPNGEIRLCVDMRRANEAIIRERHPLPTIDEVIHSVNGSQVFSKIDLKWGFHQVELDEESRRVTTFAVLDRLFQYKRLAFGVSSAPELYQKLVRDLLKDLPGIQNAADDMVVHGRDRAEHDDRLHGLLQRLAANGITVNKDKCQFRQTSVIFFGLHLSAHSVKPTAATVSAMRDARVPSNPSEVRSFLGTAGFSARFIPDFATTADPLRKLTHTGAKFVWGPGEQQAFDRLKDQVATAAALAYFDPAAPTQVIADASPVGLGAVLVQRHDGIHRPIAYASRTLTPVERRYSQTEKEALGLVWACERFHHYIFGMPFELLTDHKPLEVIYSARSKPSARIERWVLRLQQYDFKVRHIRGTANIADSLSRLPAAMAATTNATEEYVRSVVAAATPRAIRTEEIAAATRDDRELREVLACLQSGRWDMAPAAFRPVRAELAEVDGVLLRGTRLVLPQSLRARVLELAHEGHQGIVKTKERLRSKVWWPAIDRAAEKRCRACHGCQVVAPPAPPPPVKPTPLPDMPWEHLACDLLGPLPTGESLLVLVDYYSRFFEVDILKSSTTAEVIINRLDNHFCRQGLPTSLRTDNGPQFVADVFKQYLAEVGVEHRRTTPLWPRANGEVERQNRSLLKTIRVAHAEGKPWRAELRKFLLAYRATPHSTTGQTPSFLLFGRTIRDKLPSVSAARPGDASNQATRDRDAAHKQQQKDAADEHHRSKDQGTMPGDVVLLRRSEPGSKVDSPFHPQPQHVVSRNGDQVVVESPDGKLTRRNIAFTKPLIAPLPTPIPTTPEDEHLPIAEQDVHPMATPAPAMEARPLRSSQPPVWMKDYVPK